MGLTSFLGNLLSPSYRRDMAAADQGNFQADLNQIRLLRPQNVTSANPSATSPARNTYVNNVANNQSQQSSSVDTGGRLILNGQMVPQGVSGIDYENSLAKTNNNIPSTNNPPTSPAKSSYVSMLEKIYNPDALTTAYSNQTALDKRRADELLRARNAEDVIRKNDIGQLESGLNYGLNENARLSNKSLADIAIAQDAESNYINRILGAGQQLQDLSKPVSVSQGESLIQYNPDTGQYETKYQAPQAPQDIYKGLPSSAQEYLFALQNGYQGSYNDYQNMDANRKRSISNTYINGLSPYQTNQTLLNVTNKYQADSIINQAVNGQTINTIADQIIANPNSATNQLASLYVLVKNLDPTSAVREGELALANQTQSYLQRFGNVLTRLGQGQVIAPAAAKDLATATKELVKAWNSTADRRQKQYQSQATSLGVGDQFGSYLGGYNSNFGAENDPLGLGL